MPRPAPSSLVAVPLILAAVSLLAGPSFAASPAKETGKEKAKIA